MFLLDTDHIGVLQLGEGEETDRLRTRMDAYARSDFYFPIVSFHEQVVGWNNYVNRARGSYGIVRAYRMFQRILADTVFITEPLRFSAKESPFLR